MNSKSTRPSTHLVVQLIFASIIASAVHAQVGNNNRGEIPSERPGDVLPERSGDMVTTADGATVKPSACVLLKNDNVLFGHAYQVGQYIVVLTGRGGEVKLHRNDVACWAATPRDLYRFRVDHRQADDVAAHVRDARWCLRYDLNDLAEQELQTIKRLQPKHREIPSLEKQLARANAPTRAEARPLGGPSSIQPATFEQPRPDEHASAANGLDANVLRRFASHVQPMLITRCANCHSTQAEQELGSGWAFSSPTPGTRASAKMTRENLAATLPYIGNLAEQSELFIKATTPHGNGSAPLTARNAKAIGALRSWIESVVATQQVNSGSFPPATAVPRPGYSAPLTGPPPNVAPNAAAASSEPFGQVAPQGATERPTPSREPNRLPRVDNPFDPDIFNRQVQLESIERN